MPTTYTAQIQEHVIATMPARITVTLDAVATAQVVVTVRDSYTVLGAPVTGAIGSITILIGQSTGYLDWTPLLVVPYSVLFTNDSALTNPANLSLTPVDITTLYCVRSDVEDNFGKDNYEDWSQLDNDVNTSDPARDAACLVYERDEINNFFRGGRYAVPLVLATGQMTVTTWAARIAGIWLYNSRGQLDTIVQSDMTTRPFNRYAGMLKDVYAQMQAYKDGDLELDATLSATTPDEPGTFQSVRITNPREREKFWDGSCYGYGVGCDEFCN